MAKLLNPAVAQRGVLSTTLCIFACSFVALSLAAHPAQAQFAQQGPKLVGTGAAGTVASQGSSVALSADGITAIVGGPADNYNGSFGLGAAWVFTRSNGTWTQQGPKCSLMMALYIFSWAPSRCPPTAIPRPLADLATTTTGPSGCSPAATACGRSKARNWSGPAPPQVLAWASPSHCPLTATPSSPVRKATAATWGRHWCSSAATAHGRSRGPSWSAATPTPAVRFSRAGRWRCRPTATPPPSAGTETPMAQERPGCSPAATEHGRSRGLSWSARTRCMAPSKARPSRCRATATLSPSVDPSTTFKRLRARCGYSPAATGFGRSRPS
jgi:hypothetical protein